ncbi:MAG: hypothetical protein FWD23_09600 [Oscillospiraceae bacterium]|nr:hypothetical protein [Oscillospiraceae bacterium]
MIKMSKEMLDGKIVKNISVIPYSHHDYAWVCTRAWHKSRYIKCFSDVVETMQKNPDFVWHIDNVVHSLIPFLENSPEQAEQFKKYAREGRVVLLNGGYSLARPSYIGEESYIRNMTAGKKYFRQCFGVEDIPCLFNADTACGHSQMPQIAKLGGHKYYHFLRPGSTLTNKGVPFQFVWRGIDGSEVVTARGNYGSMWVLNDFLNYDFDEEWEKAKEQYFNNWLSDKVNVKLPVETVIQFIGCDDSLPLRDYYDRPLKIDEFIGEWNRREKVKMGYASLNDVFEALSKTALPAVEGVLDHAELSFNFPFKGSKSLWRMRLVLDRAIVLCEKICLLAESLGFAYPEAEIERLWLNLFEITGHATEYIQQKNAAELYDMAQMTRLEAEYIIDKAQKHITKSVRRDSEIQAVAINTNMWDIRQAVSLEVTSWHGIADFDVLDGEGNKLEYQILDCQDGYALGEGAEHISADILVVADVPAFGYTSLRIAEKGKAEKPPSERGFIDLLPANYPKDCKDEVCFSNGSLEAVFYRGNLLKLNNQKTGKSVEYPVPGLKFIEYPPESSWLTNHSEIKTHDFVPESYKILENGPVRHTYEVSGTIAGQKARIRYSAEKNSAGLDIAVRTDFEEAVEGMLVFSARADADTEIYADIPFGVEKREFFEHLPADAELALGGQVYARNWCAFTAQKTPVALVSQDCSVYYVYICEKEEMRLVLNRCLPRLTRTDRWVGKMPEETDGTGINDYRFSLIFREGADRFADIFKYQKNKAFPALAQLKYNAGKEGAAECGCLFESDRDNIINTAAYNSNGKTILRFFECEGKKTNCRIRLPANTKSVRAVDFEGNGLSDLNSGFDKAKGEAYAEFLPYKIITLELESDD